MTAVFQHPGAQAEQATSIAAPITQGSLGDSVRKPSSRAERALSPVPVTTFWLKGNGGGSKSPAPAPDRLVSTPALVKAQQVQQAQSRNTSRTGRRSSLGQQGGAQQQQTVCQSPFRRPDSRHQQHPAQPAAATSGCRGPGSEGLICTTSPVQRSTITSILDQGQGPGIHQQGNHNHPRVQIPHVGIGLGQGEGQAQAAAPATSPFQNTSSAQASLTLLPTTAVPPGAAGTAGTGAASAAVPVTSSASARLGHARALSYGNIDSTLLLFNQQDTQSQTPLIQFPHHTDLYLDQYQGGVKLSPHQSPHDQCELQHQFGRPIEAPVNITDHNSQQQVISSSQTSSSPPPAHPPAPPPQPPRRRLQPTASRRQALSHSRSRRLAQVQVAPRKQRIDPPFTHRHQSPFLPPPPSSLTACSDLSSSSLSLPSSPCPSPATISSPVPLASSSSSSSRHILSSPSPLLSLSSLPHSPRSPPAAMSRSSRNPPPTTGATRQNEYFVPRDGIDREVISADICRYLGNDALVRPGHYENPQTGQVVQGYYITAYRNLTTAMIEDLKADSARWDSERRAQTSHNTSGVQYRYSETHQSRQHHGPTEASYQQDPYSRDAYDGPRYPGTGTPGYTGAAGSSYQPQGYPSTSGGGAYGSYPQSQQSPSSMDPRFPPPQASSSMNQAFPAAQDPYMAVGTNRTPRGFTSNDPYANPAASAATTGASQPGYPATASYTYPSQVPASGAQSYATMQPQDPFYGRAGQSAQQGYSAQGQQQYEETPRARTSATPTNTQSNPSAPSARRSERDSDRHPTDRHHRSSRR